MDVLNNAIKIISAGDVIGLVGIVIGLVGIVLAVLFYRRTKRRAEISYQSRGLRILGGDASLPAGIEVRYEGKTVPRLTKFSAAFWNSGNVSIEGSRIASKDPIRLFFADDAEVVSVQVEKSTREVIQVSASIDTTRKGQVLLVFDFLDPGDGAVINVLHTSESIGAKMIGTVKGLPREFVNRGMFYRWIERRRILGVPIPSERLLYFLPEVLLAVMFFILAILPPTEETKQFDALTISFLHLPKETNVLVILISGIELLTALLGHLAVYIAIYRPAKWCPRVLGIEDE